MENNVRHLYAHIPFCPAKCSYCAFVTHVGSLKLVEPYIQALLLEARAAGERRPGGPLETVYFGGGTPSMLSPVQLSRIVRSLTDLFRLESECEVTLEAHPSTLTQDRLDGFVAAGANRISFGAESLQEGELAALGRRHGRSDILRLIADARDAGFRSVSIDLMYGIPNQTLATWEATLCEILGASPDHLSLYPLMIEPRTVFGRLHRAGGLDVPADGAVAEMYGLACSILRRAGYGHYEVSSWARPGHRCSHNLAYWRNREFYGIGVGAHGFLAPHRSENLAGTRRYVDRILSGGSPLQHLEHVDPDAALAETIMLRLRLLDEGLDLGELRRHGVDLLERNNAPLQELTASGHLQLNGHRLSLSEWAVPVANEVWSRFM